MYNFSIKKIKKELSNRLECNEEINLKLITKIKEPFVTNNAEDIIK
jgi:hypothetical protein